MTSQPQKRPARSRCYEPSGESVGTLTISFLLDEPLSPLDGPPPGVGQQLPVGPLLLDEACSPDEALLPEARPRGGTRFRVELLRPHAVCSPDGALRP